MNCHLQHVPLRPSACLLMLIILLALWMNVFAAPQNRESPVSFDFPGAANTQATAITPSGEIVGRYSNSDGVLHGFLLARGHFFSITTPVLSTPT